MKILKEKLSILVLIATLISGCKPHVEVDTTSGVIVSAIVGGTPVDPGQTEARYIVKIGEGCAGSIIAAKWIVTAAHCESQFYQPITAGGRDSGLAKSYGLQVKNYFIHPKFKEFYNGSTHDVALIELKKPIDFKATGLWPITMADSNFESSGGLEVGVMVMALGWGAIKEKGRPSHKLLKVEIPIANLEKANTKDGYKGKLDQSMLIAGFDSGGFDSCNGDSGGPLTVVGTDGETLLAGIVSFGDECARAGYPGVYAKVPYFYEWIMQKISK